MVKRIVINAENILVGRMATKIARLAKLGNEIIIVNCEKAAISGSKKNIIEKYVTNLHRGSTEKGPFQPKRPDRFVRRIIRGMMDYKGFRGKKDFARVKTFIGVPEEYENQISKDYNFKKSSDLERYKFMKVGEICKYLGDIKKW